jgi:hypothetical protein
MQSLIIKFSSNSKLLEHHPSTSGYSCLLNLMDGILIYGYVEYARFSEFQWEGGRYMERKRELLKSMRSTKNWCITNLKKSRYVKN